ncbi:MAG: c-type cytochrome [Solirubrobacteraceae bacterium]
MSAALVLAAAVLTSCSGDQAASNGDPIAGKRLFESSGCAGCHTFAGAGSSGTQGPNLDDVKPSPGRVVRQLQRGGGIMPSFADKLSDKEMRDLAAFVGAQNTSGTAVAAPFEPNDVRLADCKDSKPECLEQAFGNMTFNDGPRPALAKLTTMQTQNPAVAADCHRIAHRMGSAALKRFSDRVAPAFIAGSPVCASGYYHGIIERAFLGQPKSKLAVVARRLCSDAQINTKPFLSYQCIHGLGHGLMIYTGYDMPLSLRTCDGLKDQFTQVSCTGGVFMENFNSSYGVKSKYLRAKDPIYPCNSVAERHKLYCYLLVTANLLRVNNYDQRKAAAGCRRSEPRWVGTCFESFGRDVSGIAGKSAGKALTSCRLAGRYESDCLYGVAREIVNADANAARGGRFCTRAPANARTRCFSGVGSVLAALVTDEPRLRSTCRQVSGRHAAACLRGAGLA